MDMADMGTLSLCVVIHDIPTSVIPDMVMSSGMLFIFYI